VIYETDSGVLAMAETRSYLETYRGRRLYFDHLVEAKKRFLSKYEVKKLCAADRLVEVQLKEWESKGYLRTVKPLDQCTEHEPALELLRYIDIKPGSKYRI
jgi:hypothetical protein